MKPYTEAQMQALSGMPIWDRYAAPKLPCGVLTNATELLKNSEKNRMISLYNRDEKCNIDALSDFEYFKVLCDVLPRWIGTREGAVAEEELFILHEKSFDIACLQSEDFVRELWECAQKNLRECGGEYNAFLWKIGVEKLYNREEPFLSLGRVEKYNNEGDAVSLLCNLRGLGFVRPNAYAAFCAEQKHAQGEPLSRAEEAMLAAQSIYLCCTQERTRPVSIRLLADGDGQAASELVAYLRRLGVHGRVWLANDGRMSVDTVIALCDASDASLSIAPELVLGENDSRPYLYERLLALAARYPIDAWRFGGVLGESPLFLGGHLHMRRTLARLIAEITEDECERTRLLRQILSPSEC